MMNVDVAPPEERNWLRQLNFKNEVRKWILTRHPCLHTACVARDCPQCVDSPASSARRVVELPLMRIDRFSKSTQMNSEEMDEILMDDILEGLSPEQAPVDDLEDEAAEDSLIRLTDSKEKPREEQLDYPESLPYTTESLAQMDAKSVRLDSWMAFARLLHFLDSNSFYDDSSTASTPRITTLDLSVRLTPVSAPDR